MIIDPRRGFAFVHIPKTGGTSITSALFRDRHDVNPKGWQMKHHRRNTMHDGLRAFPERSRCLVFAFVRNPYDRIVSYYHAMRRSDPAGYPKSRAFMETAHRSDLESFLLRIEGDLKVGWFTRTQRAATRTANDVCDFIGRFERLEEDFAEVCRRIGIEVELPRINVSSHGHYRDELTPTARAVVERMWGEDLEEFGYRW